MTRARKRREQLARGPGRLPSGFPKAIPPSASEAQRCSIIQEDTPTEAPGLPRDDYQAHPGLNFQRRFCYE